MLKERRKLIGFSISFPEHMNLPSSLPVVNNLCHNKVDVEWKPENELKSLPVHI